MVVVGDRASTVHQELEMKKSREIVTVEYAGFLPLHVDDSNGPATSIRFKGTFDNKKDLDKWVEDLTDYFELVGLGKPLYMQTNQVEINLKFDPEDSRQIKH